MDSARNQFFRRSATMRHPFESRLISLISEARALSSGADRVVGDPAHLSGVFDIVTSMHANAAPAAETVGG